MIWEKRLQIGVKLLNFYTDVTWTFPIYIILNIDMGTYDKSHAIHSNFAIALSYSNKECSYHIKILYL